MQNFPNGTVTFLFSDIAGSTKLWKEYPDAMRPALDRHNFLLRQSIENNSGYVFKTIGDAFCAAFSTAPNALQAALSAQLALAAEAWDLPIPLAVRLALHTGATEESGGDYFGIPLSRVARLMAAGHGGQTLLSDVTQELVRDVLPPEVTLRDLGQHRLKDLGRPEHVFQLQYPDLPADFPPLRSLDNPDLPNNLPQQPTSFVGREKEVEEIKVLLGKTHLLTLSGAGGSGKTRLSLQVAADLLTGDGDGVWLVELAALTESALVPQALAQVLGVKAELGKSIQQTLVAALKAKRLLIVLDNCEHLVAACASLAADVLRNCPDVHLLASSREPLNVSGEQIYRVPSLSVPDPKQVKTVEALSQYEAVRLFIERAQAVQPSFAVTNANAPSVAQVCWRLDGIPLAIELAAARVRAMPVEQVMVRLDDRFRLLTGGSRNALPRQQTLRATMDWSYDLLADTEKWLLRQMSVFAGGWSLEAAEVVCNCEGIEGWEVLDVLTSLVDKSLVVYGEERDVARYHLLETVRQYADEHLRGSGWNAARQRHFEWCVAFVDENNLHLMGAEDLALRYTAVAEEGNLRAATIWWNSENSEAIMDASRGGQRDVWKKADAMRLLGTLMRVQSAKRLRGLEPGSEPQARAEGLQEAGKIAAWKGDRLASRRSFEASLVILREHGDERTLDKGLMIAALSAHELNDFEVARRLYGEFLANTRRLGHGIHEDRIRWALSRLGDIAQLEGDLAAARSAFEECLKFTRQSNEPQATIGDLIALADVVFLEGDDDTAKGLYREALTILARFGGEESADEVSRLASKVSWLDSILGLAAIASKQGQSVRAMHLYGVAEALHSKFSIAKPKGLIGDPGREEHEGRIGALRNTLGAEAFATAWAECQAMTMDEVVEYALEKDV